MTAWGVLNLYLFPVVEKREAPAEPDAPPESPQANKQPAEQDAAKPNNQEKVDTSGADKHEGQVEKSPAPTKEPMKDDKKEFQVRDVCVCVCAICIHETSALICVFF